MNTSENESEICIEEIKKIIYSYHKNHVFFNIGRPLTFLYAFLIFEVQCATTYSYRHITDSDKGIIQGKYLDSIATLIYWIYDEAIQSNAFDLGINPIYFNCSLEIFDMSLRFSDLRTLFYSEDEENILVNGNKITFTFSHKNIESVNSEITDSISNDITSPDGETCNELDISIKNLTKSIEINNDRINYKLFPDIIKGFQKEREYYWEHYSQLDKYWNKHSFEKFTYSSFKKFWIALSTWCSIHFYSFLSNHNRVNSGKLAENILLIYQKSEYIETISNIAKINVVDCEIIFDYLTYDHGIKNNDIIFQPIFHLNDNYFVIAPHLLLKSKAERNLIALLHKKEDKEYFDVLTNSREKIMQEELKNSIINSEECIIALNKNIKNMELDYAIYEPKSKNVLLCELKWSNEPDSAAEVINHEDYLQKGCNQIKRIRDYAKSNSNEFMKSVFNINIEEKIEYSCCVISKNYIRTQDTTVPVLNLNKFIKIYNIENGNIKNLINQINEKKYLTPLATNFYDLEKKKSIGEYAGYIFEIPIIYRVNLKDYFQEQDLKS